MNNICQLFDLRFCHLINRIIKSKTKKKIIITYHCSFQVWNLTLIPLIKRIFLLTLLCFPKGLMCFSLEVSSLCSSRSREVMPDLFLLLSHSSVPAELEPWCLRLLASQAEGCEGCFQSSITNSSLTPSMLCRQEDNQSPDLDLKCQKGQQIPDLRYCNPQLSR